MPFISDTEERRTMQSVIRDDGSVDTNFSETFDAAVGFAFDEGLSTSRMLNNEMYENRRIEAKKLFDSGVSRGTYIDHLGRIDYNSMSNEFENIKPDWELNDQKKTLLAERREYYNDVMKRNPSMAANFMGSATAFMLDPINMATMGVGTPYAVAKGASVISRVLYGAGGAAAINLGAEALIQPFVLDYKMDIDSPYTATDAIANIAMAAGGGLILGGAAGGISGWLRKIRGEAEKIKITDDLDVDEIKVAVDQIDDMIETLKTNPEKIDIEAVRASSLDRIKAELTDTASIRLEASELRQLKTEQVNLESTLKEIEVDQALAAKAGEVSGKQLIEAQAAAARLEKGEQLTVIEQKLQDISQKLERNEQAIKASKELDNIEKDKPPKHVEKKVEEDIHKAQVDSEANYLKALEEEKTRLNRTPDEVETPKTEEIKDKDLEDVFRAMDEPVVIKDDSFVLAKDIVDGLNEDIKGLESVRTCILG